MLLEGQNVNFQKNSARNGLVARRPPGLEEQPKLHRKSRPEGKPGAHSGTPESKGERARRTSLDSLPVALGIQTATAAAIAAEIGMLQPDFVFEQTSTTTGFGWGRAATETGFRQSQLDRNRKCDLQKSRPQLDSDSPRRNSNRIPSEKGSTPTGFRQSTPQ